MAKRAVSVRTETSLSLGGVRLLPTQMVFERDLSIQEWENLGSQLRMIGEGVQWWIGDWLAYGEHTYGEKYKVAAQVMEHSIQRMANWRWVAGKFETSRRREKLTYTHHELVAALPPKQQDYWLNLAEANDLNTKQLGRAMKDVAKGEKAAQSGEEAELVEIVKAAPSILELFALYTDEYEGAVLKLSNRANQAERRRMADRIQEIAEKVESGRKAK